MATIERSSAPPPRGREESAGAGPGLWSWLLQRISAVLIAFFLGVHMWVLHIDKVGEKITIDRVADRLQSPWSIAVYAVLLAAVLYHSLNGILNISADFGLGARAHRALSWALLGVGVAGLGLGVATIVHLVRIFDGAAG